MNLQQVGKIQFPHFSGIRCLMMPFIQGDPESVPKQYREGYEAILGSVFFDKGDIGYLTVDESLAKAGTPHRGARAKHGRALHTEAGRIPGSSFVWGHGWGKSHTVRLDADVQVLLANNTDASCALWDAFHEQTSVDGDIGDFADSYPYSTATIMNAGDVYKIGILTPHESLPVKQNTNRQFLRIVSSGVHGREDYFTQNPLVNWAN